MAYLFFVIYGFLISSYIPNVRVYAFFIGCLLCNFMAKQYNIASRGILCLAISALCMSIFYISNIVLYTEGFLG